MRGILQSEDVSNFYSTIFWYCFINIIALILLAPRVVDGARPLLRFTLIAMLANAMVCATIQHSEARYQSRVVWLLPICMAVIGESLNRRVKRLSSIPDLVR
jgi:hypothetical protein